MKQIRPVFGKTIEKVRHQLIGGQMYLRAASTTKCGIFMDGFIIAGVLRIYQFVYGSGWFINGRQFYFSKGVMQRFSGISPVYLCDNGIIPGHGDRNKFTVKYTERNIAILQRIVAEQDYAAFEQIVRRKSIFRQ